MVIDFCTRTVGERISQEATQRSFFATYRSCS
jgi:hypothetical protein